jgi:hypothetical protein
MSRAICVGAARTVNYKTVKKKAIKRSQLAAFQGMSFSSIPRAAACEALAFRTFCPAPAVLERDAAVDLSYPLSSVPVDTRALASNFRRTAFFPNVLMSPYPSSGALAPAEAGAVRVSFDCFPGFPNGTSYRR